MARPRRGGGFTLLDLHYADQLSGQLLGEELERAGIRPEWAGLITEIRTVEPVRPTELGQRTGLPPATLYDYLERLVADGLVHKLPNPEDGRSFLLETTPAGREAVQVVSRAVRRAHERFAEQLELPLEDVQRAVADLRFALEAALNPPATQ
jgi:DNA-binding MarR family transcriptional regulator